LKFTEQPAPSNASVIVSERLRGLEVDREREAGRPESKIAETKAITPFCRSRIAARIAGSLSAVVRASAGETAGLSRRGPVRPGDVAISGTIASPATATRLTDAL
jgi:hypothetical protein